MNKYKKQIKYAPYRFCFEDEFDEDNRIEWRYAYNPFNEREQRKMHYTRSGNNSGNVYPWNYYQLGIDNKQFTVYNGLQITDPWYETADYNICQNVFPQILMIYPVEHNVYGADGKIDVAWRLNALGQWDKEFNLFDHLGNQVMTLTTNGIPKSKYRYEAFGKQITISGNGTERLGFIGKENDNESQLGDFGVRKYDEDIGRFTSIDPLFEKYNGWNPYQYSRNNPVNAYDDNGKFDESVHTEAIVAAGGNIILANLNYFVNDWTNAGVDDLHFDNKKTYGDVKKTIDKAGGFDKLDDHSIGDFYAHSNYVEIWDQLSQDGTVSGDAPTLENVKSFPAFQSALENQLRTTNWESPLFRNVTNDPYDHYEGDKVIAPKLQVGNDGKTLIKPFASKDNPQSTYHLKAKELYIRSLKIKHETQKKND